MIANHRIPSYCHLGSRLGLRRAYPTRWRRALLGKITAVSMPRVLYRVLRRGFQGRGFQECVGWLVVIASRAAGKKRFPPLGYNGCSM